MMVRAILFCLLVAAGLVYWKREEAAKFASERVPALAPYLTETKAARGPARAGPAIPVVVTRATRKSLPIVVEAVGTVQPVASIQIKPRLDSQIATVQVEEGALVKEGDMLATLDARALKAQLAQQDALIQKDRAQIEQARRDFARADELLAKRIGTEVQRDTASTQVKMQQAQLAADEAQRDNIATMISYTEIRSPISGRIGSIALKTGTSIRSADAQAIMTVNQIDPIYVQFAVPQSLFGDLRAAMTAGPVSVEAKVGNATVNGKVTFVENTVDLATGTVLARALMANAGEQLWPGAFVSVRAILGRDADAITVPSAAVQIGQQGAYLFVVRDNKASLVQVTVPRSTGQEAVVSTGLTGGELVVIEGQLRLVHGATVQVQPGGAGDGVATTGSAVETPPARRS